jgi:hypothetical protein
MHFNVFEKLIMDKRISCKISTLSNNKTVTDAYQTAHDRTIEAKAFGLPWQDCSALIFHTHFIYDEHNFPGHHGLMC